MKVSVSLGITLCTDPEKRNFLRIGMEALEVDPNGNVEEQAQAALVAGIKVLRVLDEGLQEEVEQVASDLEGVPVSLREDLGHVKGAVGRLEDAATRIVNRMKTLITDVDTLKGAQPAISPSAAAVPAPEIPKEAVPKRKVRAEGG